MPGHIARANRRRLVAPGAADVGDDGSDLVVYTDGQGAQPCWAWQIKPPYEEVIFGDDEIAVDLTKRGAKARKGVVIATSVLESEGETPTTWRELEPGSLLVIRQGAIVFELPPRTSAPSRLRRATSE